jgi:hypothetical protein
MTDQHELARRESHLMAIVQRELPEFAGICNKHVQIIPKNRTAIAV